MSPSGPPPHRAPEPPHPDAPDAPPADWRRMPRARLDPITSAGDALTVISAAIHRPLVAETIVLVLDDDRRGLSLITVTGTVDDDSILEVVDCFAAIACDAGAGALVVASVRPGTAAGTPPRLRELDIDRWLEASDASEHYGVELTEWFVVEGTAEPTHVTCPRDALGERPRW